MKILPAEPRSPRQIEEEFNAQTRQQAAVADLGRQALASHKLSEFMDIVVRKVTETLGVEYCNVLELLPDGNNFLHRAGIGWQEGWVGHNLVSTGTETQAGYALLSSEPTVVEDWKTETRFKPSSLLQAHQVISGVSVVIAGKQPFGVLSVHTSHKRSFTDYEIYFLQAVANVLALAIHAQTEESLRQQTNLVELSDEPILLWGFDNGIIFWNRGCEQLYGFPRERAMGQVSHELLQTVHPIPFEQFRATLEREGQWAGEITHIASDGREVIVESRHMLVQDLSGRRLVLETNRDITARIQVERRAKTEAEATQKRLALLAETRERNRMAQELHDVVAQALGYLNLRIASIITLLANGQIQTAEAQMREVKDIVAETYTDVREEIFNLRANTFVGLGFLELLHRYIDKYRNFYNMDIQLIIEADEALFQFPAEVGPQLIRTIQEALINVRKHAKVNQAIIRLSRDENQLHISVEDGGQGFDLTEQINHTSSFGLQIMRERVESVGGNLKIDAAPGQGTRVVLTFPFAHKYPA